MRVNGPDGRQHTLSLAGREVRADDLTERSLPHRWATALLRELLPFDRLYQEITLPGADTRLTVDLMVPARRLAVEVQGRQHREYCPHFHGTRFGWLSQIKNDRLKVAWFALNDWTLVALHDDDHGRWRTGSSPPWLDRARADLERWEESLGLAPLAPPNPGEAARLAQLSATDRSKLTREQAADAAVACVQFAVFIGRACQREESDALLIRERVLRGVTGSLEGQTVYGREERVLAACRQDAALWKLDAMRVAAEVKAKRLAYLATRFEKLGQTFDGLSRSRERRNAYGD